MKTPCDLLNDWLYMMFPPLVDRAKAAETTFADALAEYEADNEVHEPAFYNSPFYAHTEPALSDDELVAVRQLIEDRFPDMVFPAQVDHPPDPCAGSDFQPEK